MPADRSEQDTSVAFVWQSFHGTTGRWWDLPAEYVTEAMARECDPRRFNATLPEYRLRLVERTTTDRAVPT